MLTLIVPKTELFDEESSSFLGSMPEISFELEHSLASLSKWESIWEKPFLSKTEKTTEETLSYIKCMTLTPNVPDEVYNRLSGPNIHAVSEYIDKKHSATWFTDHGPKGSGNTSGEANTAETIYYWMISLNIPLECQYWHFNKLMTFIRVCNEKNSPKKKLSKSEALAQQRTLNEQRKARFGTNG